MKTIRNGSLWVAAALLGLGASVSNAAEVSVTCPVGATIWTDPASFCWDYSDNGNIPPDTIDPILAPGVFPSGAQLDDNVLQLPLNYTYLDGADGGGLKPSVPVKGGGDAFALFPGSLNITCTNGDCKTGTFSFSTLTSSLPFILYLKYGNNWTAFLLGDGVTSGRFSLTEGLSNWQLYGDADETRYVPLPAAAWLMLSGLVALFGIGRRRKSSVVAAA
jgi:hypothetical protein